MLFSVPCVIICQNLYSKYERFFKMSNGDLNKLRHKRPKFKILSSSDPETSVIVTSGIIREDHNTESLYPLLAKDSEWVDILRRNMISKSVPNVQETEEVENDDGPDAKPLALMFPALLERDPETLEGILTKAMSTTEVTKHLVDLGQKANFMFMKKVNRLIPRDKKWLESLSENSNSYCSTESETQLNLSLTQSAPTSCICLTDSFVRNVEDNNSTDVKVKNSQSET